MMRTEAQGATKGAIYVEFLIAFFPVFTMFVGLVQLADLYQANIIVNHAAQMTARAAAVVLHDDPQFYGNDDDSLGKPTGQRKEAIEHAAMLSLLASRSISEFKVSYPSTAGGSDNKDSYTRDDLVRVKVEATFQCRVPFVNKLVCSSKSIRTLKSEAAFPNQGMAYTYSQ
jgi:hypothetical protein